MDAESMGQGRVKTAVRCVPLHSGTALKTRIAIRRATRLDLPSILRIENACFGENAWGRDLFDPYFDHPVPIFLVAATAMRTVGYAVAAPRTSTWALDSIAVSPRARGRGVATLLLRRIIQTLIRRKAAKLSLMVRRDNSAAIHLYKKLGFKSTGSVDNYYEDGAAAWRMRLELIG